VSAGPPPVLPDWIERQLPPGITRRTVDVGGLRMHVMEAGEGRPVLAVHGNPAWSFLHRKVAAALAGEPFRLVMPDLVGLGLSDRPPRTADHTIDNHARWLGALIDTLELRDAIAVVQDWGGPITLRALAERPRTAGGLVLLNTVVGPPRAGFRPRLFHRFARWPVVSDAAFRLLGFPLRHLHRVQGDPGSIRGDVARAYRWPLRRGTGNAAPLELARMVPDSDRHPSIPALRRAQEFLQAFRGPVAAVWGERDPILGRVIGWIETLLPQAEVTRTSAGHFVQEEVPEAVAAAVRRVARRALIA
jgi:cis-3-alkyl-4-acyloxetan-2-one decarboxylase